MSIPIWIIILFVGVYLLVKGYFTPSRGIGDLEGLLFQIAGAIIILGLLVFYAGMYFGRAA